MNKNMSFEEAMLALENAVDKLEHGDQSLDESLTTFEEAIKLIKMCNAKLDAAEQKVRMLVESSDGTVTDTAFKKNDEA